MNLKILFMLLAYYAIIIIVIASPNSPISEVDYTANINSSAMTEDEQATGIFDVLPAIGRFVALVGFGVGMPSDTPASIAYAFIVWQSLITMFTIGFLYSSIWNG